MAGFVQGIDREQVTLFPVRLDEYVAEDNPVRAVDAFVDGLDLDGLGFAHVQPLDIGRPGYHPRMMLKLYHPFPPGRCTGLPEEIGSSAVGGRPTVFVGAARRSKMTHKRHRMSCLSVRRHRSSLGLL